MKVLDLRPDPKLLKTNFDGYKLSLETTPVLKLENISKPLKISQTSSEFSFLHSILFSLHNHLVSDPWLSNTAYYIDHSLTIYKVFYQSNSGKLNSSAVFKFKNNNQSPTKKKEGTFNAEIKFISEKYALISDGTGSLLIVDTGDRQKNDEWKKIDSINPLDDDDNGFILQDAKFTIENGEKTIHSLLLHIKQIDDKFYNIIDWITLQEDTNTKKWKSISNRRIKGKGTLYYLSFDIYCTSIVYSSNHEYKYVFDSVNEIVEEPTPSEVVPMQTDESVINFQWSQKKEEITINFNRIAEATKDMYNVKCLQSHIEIKCEEEFLIDSDLFAEIDIDLTTWSLENDYLQLNLVKRQPELIWPYLTPTGPKEISSGCKKTQLLSSHQPVADLNTQMEECDYGDDGRQNDEYFIGKNINFFFKFTLTLIFFIEQLDSTSHKAIHKVYLGSNHPLFSITLRPGFPKAIAIRSDVDCCLWLQHQIIPNEEWTLRHEG